jgi:hypothetical protein
MIEIVSRARYFDAMKIVVSVDGKRYTYLCYNTPRLLSILEQFRVPKARKVAFNRLKKEAQVYAKDHEEPKQDWSKGCPSCKTPEPNYQVGAECPGCGFKEWLNGQDL